MEQQMTKEQADAMQEKLKNMSPEELKEFQKQQCIFCHIISGKVSSKKVYEDDTCMAVLDINPANPGHILLLPKEHYSIMPQLSDEDTAHLFMVTKHLSHVLLKALKVEGTNIFVANGIVAGQRAQHLMIHIIPRKENDSLNLVIPEGEMSENDINAVMKLLTEGMVKTMGAAVVEQPKEPIQKRPIVQEADFEEEKIITEEKKFVKSKKSDKYHVSNCPFAKRIKEKVHLTKEEANEFKPCACVDGAVVIKRRVVKPKKQIKSKEAAEKQKEVNLDDISEILG